MLKSSKGFASWLNNQNTALLIFILCMINFFSLYLEGGEEQYLAFAKQYMDPFWMPNSFSLNHPAGGNLAFQVITGYFLRYFSFEQVAFAGRILNFLMYAIPLSMIFKKLKISNIEIVFLLQVIYFYHQSLYAGEWIFKNLEEKTLSYIFVFWSLYFLLDDKPVFSMSSAVISTWFHFLVGGWMAGFIFIYFIVRRQQLRHTLTGLFIYLIFTAPLIAYLYKTYMTGNPAVVNGLNTNAIYAFWRLKHHLGIFHDARYFFKSAFWGVSLTLLFFATCLVWFRRINNKWIRRLNTLNIIVFSQQVIFMVIALFDRNGILMKTYPFRTASVSFLLYLIEVTLVCRHFMPYVYRRVLKEINLAYPQRKKVFLNSINYVLLVVGLVFVATELHYTLKTMNKSGDRIDPDYLALFGYIRSSTPGSSVFMLLDDDRPCSFIRRTERERFVVEKFTPTKSQAIYEWYKRAMLRKRIKRDISLIDSAKAIYRIDYLVTDSALNYPSVALEKKAGKHLLYRIKQ